MTSATRHLQMERSECGLACIAKASASIGQELDLAQLRRQFPASRLGSTLQDLMEVAQGVGLSAQAVRCDAEEATALGRGAILHWRGNHFVVLDEVKPHFVRIFDPAIGFKALSREAFSANFSGAALQIEAGPGPARHLPSTNLGLRRLFTWSADLQRTAATLALLFGALQVCVAAAPYELGRAIDAVGPGGTRASLPRLVLTLGGLALLKAMVDTLEGLSLEGLNALLSRDMSQRLFRHMMSLPLAWFERRRTAAVENRFAALATIQTFLAADLPVGIVSGVSALTAGVAMLWLKPSLALIGMAAIAALIGLRFAIAPAAGRALTETKLATAQERNMRSEPLRAIRTVKLLGREEESEAIWLKRLAEKLRADSRLARFALAKAVTQRLIGDLCDLLLLFVGAQMVFRGDLTVGTLIAIVIYGAYARRKGLVAAGIIFIRRDLEVPLARLGDVLNAAAADTSCVEYPADATPRGEIALDGVSYRYPGAKTDVVKDASCRIAAGQLVVILGASGAGKTTLLNLLCGMAQPIAGEVRFDGRVLSASNARSVRRAMGFVQQDDHLLAGSIMRGVTGGDHEADPVRVWEALRMAGFDQAVSALPMRLETKLGDGGMALSNEQRQRLLLARALYRRPAVLLLDDATAGLDAAGESHFLATISALPMTRIVLSRRMTATVAIDRRFMLTRGCLEEIAQQQGPRPTPAADRTAPDDLASAPLGVRHGLLDAERCDAHHGSNL